MMQAQLTGKNKKGLVLCLSKGFSTLEILIAFAVLILCITAVILVVFGNQSVAVDTQTNIEAISKAKALLEKARADSREDFESIETSSEINDDIYKKQLVVPLASITDCGKDIQSIVNWNVGSRILRVDFTSHIVNLALALAIGGDCDDTLPGDWDNPITATSVGIGGQGATNMGCEVNAKYS